MILSLARRSRGTRSGVVLVAVVIALFARAGLPRVAAQPQPSSAPSKESKLERRILRGVHALEFRAARMAANEKLQRSNVQHSDRLENLHITSIKLKHDTNAKPKGILARLGDTLFGPSTVEAAEAPEDCEEYLMEVSNNPAEAKILRAAFRMTGCEDIEAVNIYYDHFESNINVTGGLGLSTEFDIEMDGPDEYAAYQAEIDLPIVAGENDTWVIDQDPLLNLANQFMFWLVTTINPL